MQTTPNTALQQVYTPSESSLKYGVIAVGQQKTVSMHDGFFFFFFFFCHIACEGQTDCTDCQPPSFVQKASIHFREPQWRRICHAQMSAENCFVEPLLFGSTYSFVCCVGKVFVTSSTFDADRF